MHNYLRSIGFGKIYKRRELKDILRAVLRDPTEKQYVTIQDDSIAVEYRKDFTKDIGIAVCGEFSDSTDFDYEFYYPYFRNNKGGTRADIEIDRYAERETFAGLFDDSRFGISIIFFLQNRLDYLKYCMKTEVNELSGIVTLSGLALNGIIMLPIKKDQRQIQENKEAVKNRKKLITAARQGDESAIETLTWEDIDTYTAISKKIQNEDVFSLVDTYLMPYGIESDQYSILGEIIHCRMASNHLTNEIIYIITLNCNDLIVHVCINKRDLVGEPLAGRRFRGVVWLQGRIEFQDS